EIRGFPCRNYRIPAREGGSPPGRKPTTRQRLHGRWGTVLKERGLTRCCWRSCPLLIRTSKKRLLRRRERISLGNSIRRFAIVNTNYGEKKIGIIRNRSHVWFAKKLVPPPLQRGTITGWRHDTAGPAHGQRQRTHGPRPAAPPVHRPARRPPPAAALP